MNENFNISSPNRRDEIEQIQDELNKQNNYDNSEVIVGTWIDGKPIYRKVIQTTTPDTASSPIDIYDCTDLNIETVLKIDGSIYVTNANGNQSVWNINTYRNTNVFSEFHFQLSSNKNEVNSIRAYVSSSFMNSPCIIILEYTKHE